MFGLRMCTAIIKNNTDRDLSNIKLVWLGKPNFPAIFKMIKKGKSKRAGIPSLVEGCAPLKMYYTDENNYRNEYTIFEELHGLCDKLICITVIGIYEDGGLNYILDPCYDPYP